MPRLMILEDEAVLRDSMARGLRKVPGLEVVEAGNMAEAVALLDSAPPDLVFSDIDLPDRAGLEILGELGSRSLRIPVVFISAFLKAYGPQIPRHANVEVRSKPVSVEELRRIVTERLGRTGGAAAAPFSAIDYLQLAGMGRHTVEIELRRHDQLAGRIEVVAGEPWSAEDTLGAGVEAFLRVAFSRDGTIECRTLQLAPRPRNIDARMEELLLEGARLADEQARTEPGPPAEAPPQAAPPAPPVRPARPTETSPGLVPPQAVTPAAAAPDPFDACFEEAVSALLARDHAKAYALFVVANRLRPGDRKVEANLTRLRDMGLGDHEPGGSGGGEA